jgi:hypothetical protein
VDVLSFLERLIPYLPDGKIVRVYCSAPVKISLLAREQPHFFTDKYDKVMDQIDFTVAIRIAKDFENRWIVFSTGRRCTYRRSSF